MTTDSDHRDQGPGNVADPYRDLLSRLDERRRRGLVHRLAVGYYEGWRPTRDEIADLVALETGQIGEAEYLARRRSHPRPPEQRHGRPVNPSAPAPGDPRPAASADRRQEQQRIHPHPRPAVAPTSQAVTDTDPITAPRDQPRPAALPRRREPRPIDRHLPHRTRANQRTPMSSPVPATPAGVCECCSTPYRAGAPIVWDSVVGGWVLPSHRSAGSRR